MTYPKGEKKARANESYIVQAGKYIIYDLIINSRKDEVYIHIWILYTHLDPPKKPEKWDHIYKKNLHEASKQSW